MRVAFYGGSFNPPHYSHFFAMAWALCSGEVDEVWMVPCAEHAFGKALAPFADRVKMCQLGAATLSEKIKVSTIEAEMAPPNYTIHTIEALQSRYPQHHFRLLVGADILLEKDAWRDFPRLVQLAPLLLIGRAGVEGVEQGEILLPQISSTEIRQRLARKEEVTALLPRVVLSYIQQHALYQNLSPC